MLAVEGGEKVVYVRCAVGYGILSVVDEDISTNSHNARHKFQKVRWTFPNDVLMAEVRRTKVHISAEIQRSFIPQPYKA